MTVSVIRKAEQIARQRPALVRRRVDELAHPDGGQAQVRESPDDRHERQSGHVAPGVHHPEMAEQQTRPTRC